MTSSCFQRSSKPCALRMHRMQQTDSIQGTISPERFPILPKSWPASIVLPWNRLSTTISAGSISSRRRSLLRKRLGWRCQEIFRTVLKPHERAAGAETLKFFHVRCAAFSAAGLAARHCINTKKSESTGSTTLCDTTCSLEVLVLECDETRVQPSLHPCRCQRG